MEGPASLPTLNGGCLTHCCTAAVLPPCLYCSVDARLAFLALIGVAVSGPRVQVEQAMEEVQISVPEEDKGIEYFWTQVTPNSPKISPKSPLIHPKFTPNSPL